MICALLHLLFWVAGMVTGATYLVAWLERANDPADDSDEQFLPYSSGFVSFLWEWGTTLLLWITWPLGFLDIDPYPQSGHPRPPIVLVHGWGMNRAQWLSLRWKLRRAGYANVFTVCLPLRDGDLEAHAERLHDRLQELAPYFDEPRWVLIGHGMGGLVIRRYLRTHGDPGIERVFLIGTPNEGNKLASLMPSEAARQMRPGSDFLQSLKRKGKREPKDRMRVIASRFDNGVVPWRSTLLKDVETVQFDFVGHHTLIASRDVFRAILNDLGGRPLARREPAYGSADDAPAAEPDTD